MTNAKRVCARSFDLAYTQASQVFSAGQQEIVGNSLINDIRLHNVIAYFFMRQKGGQKAIHMYCHKPLQTPCTGQGALEEIIYFSQGTVRSRKYVLGASTAEQVFSTLDDQAPGVQINLCTENTRLHIVKV